MRIIFIGTGDFGLPSLEALVDEGQEVPLIVTQPDRPAGRGQAVRIGPIKRFARDRGIPTFQPEDINTPPSVRRIEREKPDLLLVVAYGQKLGPKVLRIARHGAVNLHGSLLPKYRGAAPVNWAVIHGETETGLSLIQMTDEIDAGDILGQRATQIGTNETAGELAERLAALGARLVTEMARDITLEEVGRRHQTATQATPAPRLKKADGLINWDRPARQVHNHIRGTTPWPGAFTFLPTKRGKPPLRVVINRSTLPAGVEAEAAPGSIVAASAEGIDVATAQGVVRVLELTPAGKRTLSAAEFINGYPVEPGMRLLDASQSAVS